MKKLLAALTAVTVFVCVFTACSDKSANPQSKKDNDSPDSNSQSGVINPLAESTADDILEKLGIALGVPDGAENVKYFILAGDTEELRFTLNGLDCTARLKATAGFEDISGMYYTWTDTIDGKIKECECKQMRYSGDEGDIDVCLWYDAAPGLMYSLTAQGSSLDDFDITETALQVYEPMQNNN